MISHLCHICYISRPFYPQQLFTLSILGEAYKLWSLSLYFISIQLLFSYTLKYSPHRPDLRSTHSQSLFFSWHETQTAYIYSPWIKDTYKLIEKMITTSTTTNGWQKFVPRNIRVLKYRSSGRGSLERSKK